MSGIHGLLLNKIKDELTAALITNVDATDNAIAGVVKIGPLQGDPDPDEARISIELYYNDPDQTIKTSGVAKAPDDWADQVYDIEVGGAVTWRRRFTVKARCLFDRSQEGLTDALDITSTVRSRIEKCLLGIRFSGVSTTDEYVARGIIGDCFRSEVTQAGGPPDAYDFYIKIRIEVLTTQTAG
jgi:hypothetical protein